MTPPSLLDKLLREILGYFLQKSFGTQSWDTASKAGELNDYSVCTTWLVRDRAYYLIDVFRERLGYPGLRRAVIDQYHRWRPSGVLIEDNASGLHLIQDLRHAGDVFAIAVQPEGDKVVRAHFVAASIEGDRVLLPERAAWLGEFEKEMLAFPLRPARRSGRQPEPIPDLGPRRSRRRAAHPHFRRLKHGVPVPVLWSPTGSGHPLVDSGSITVQLKLSNRIMSSRSASRLRFSGSTACLRQVGRFSLATVPSWQRARSSAPARR